MLKRFVQFYQKQESLTFWATVSSVVLALFLVALWAINYPQLPDKLPLFYSLSWGEAQLAPHTHFLILPALIMLTMLINLFISWHLHKSQGLLKKLLSCTTLAVAILISITAIKIIYTFI